ncbi:retrovirus-related pol polyprotein from transposon TNT 1-94 [Tanacetum coccineum]
MDSEKYPEGQSMQRPPLFESDSFIYCKNRFETYVKSKDLDLWHVITNGDFQPIIQNPETKLDEVVPFEKQTDDLKRRLAKNNEAKMVIYNALPRKEYERIFMCNTAKEIWKTFVNARTIKVNSQNSAFARFNTIITSLKALDEGYYSKNYVRKFLRALHPKWRAKVMAIKESKDLTSLSLKIHWKPTKSMRMAWGGGGEWVRHGGKRLQEVTLREEVIRGDNLRTSKRPFKEPRTTKNGKSERKVAFDAKIHNHLIRRMSKGNRETRTKENFVELKSSSSGTKDIKFMKAQKKTCSDGGPIIIGGPLNDLAAPKINMGLPPVTPGSEKTVTFQKSILGPRSKHIIVKKVKVPVASDNEVKHFYKPIAQPGICLGADLEPDEWIKDSGCSKHMTGNRKLFFTYKAYNGGNVVFGSNLRGNIIGKGTISNDSLKIDNVEHVDNLGFNLLSIGQICDNKCRVTFFEHDSEITKDGKVIGRGIRKKGLYVMKLGNKPKYQICLATINDNSTLWHRRLGHANMRLIQSLASKELVRNLPKLKFDQHFCDACKIRKQAHASHKAKNVVSTTKCLELLLCDFFGPSAVRSYGGNRYTLVIVDDYSRKIKESRHVTFDETPPPSKTSPLVDDDLDEKEAIREIEKKNLENVVEDETLEIDEIVNIKESMNHP